MATNDLDDFNFGFEEDFSSLLTFSPEVQEAIDEVIIYYYIYIFKNRYLQI